MIERLTIRRPDDWHMHRRDDALLAGIAGPSLAALGRALIEPSLVPLTKGAPWQPPNVVETGEVETGVVEIGAVETVVFEAGEAPVTVFYAGFPLNWRVEEAA